MLCCHRRQRPARVVACVAEESHNITLLRITVPKRTRWAPHDEQHKKLIYDKTMKAIKHMETLPDGEERLRAFITLYNDLIAQPIMVASYGSFRAGLSHKLDELQAWAKTNTSVFEDELAETSHQFHELLCEIHDHPLYRD